MEIDQTLLERTARELKQLSAFDDSEILSTDKINLIRSQRKSNLLPEAEFTSFIRSIDRNYLWKSKHEYVSKLNPNKYLTEAMYLVILSYFDWTGRGFIKKMIKGRVINEVGDLIFESGNKENTGVKKYLTLRDLVSLLILLPLVGICIGFLIS